jgi:hypothetical protein
MSSVGVHMCLCIMRQAMHPAEALQPNEAAASIAFARLNVPRCRNADHGALCKVHITATKRHSLFCCMSRLLLYQGEYCLQLKMDIIPGSGIAAVGAQTVQVPSAPQSITRQVRSSAS